MDDADGFKSIKMIDSPKVFLKHRLDLVGNKPVFLLDLVPANAASPQPKRPVESVVSGIGSEDFNDDEENVIATDQTPMQF